MNCRMWARENGQASGQPGPPSAVGKDAGWEHWQKVEKVLSDLATDKRDPLTAMRELQKLTGSTSVTESAAEVKRLVTRLGEAR